MRQRPLRLPEWFLTDLVVIVLAILICFASSLQALVISLVAMAASTLSTDTPLTVTVTTAILL